MVSISVLINQTLLKHSQIHLLASYFELQGKSCVVTTNYILLAKPKIFTILFFT